MATARPKYARGQKIMMPATRFCFLLPKPCDAFYLTLAPDVLASHIDAATEFYREEEDAATQSGKESTLKKDPLWARYCFMTKCNLAAKINKVSVFLIDGLTCFQFMTSLTQMMLLLLMKFMTTHLGKLIAAHNPRLGNSRGNINLLFSHAK